MANAFRVEMFHMVVLGKQNLDLGSNMIKKGFSGPRICVLCRSEMETISHLFLLCPFIKKVWEECC